MAKSQAPTNKNSKRKAANYQEHKDVQLCRLCIAISEDLLVGTNQEGSKFWGCVATHYNNGLPGINTRTFGSLKVLQKTINKFRVCVNNVEQQNQDGALAENC